MKAIFHFENFPATAQHFNSEYIKPLLLYSGTDQTTSFLFQSYIDNSKGFKILEPSEVAKRACRDWEKLKPVPDKTVWILDLSPTSGNTPESSYGFCVLIALAKVNGLTLNQFLSYNSFLTVVLTNYIDKLATDDGLDILTSARCDLTDIKKEWKGVHKIVNPKFSKSKLAYKEESPRIVLGSSARDENWLANQIVSW